MIQEDKAQNQEDWLNEHGEPDIEYLNSLATDGGAEALEKLKSIAEDLDVEYNSGTSTEELIERIRAAVEENQDSGLQPTT